MKLTIREIRESVKIIMSEGVVDDLKKKSPGDVELIDRLASHDTSPTKKYVSWMLKQVKAGANEQDIVPSVLFFHKNNQRFDQRDINSYDAKSLEDKVKELGLVSKTKDRNRTKIEGADKIFEDDKRLLMRMLTKRACMVYGSGTKWCITMENADYYESYVKRGIKFYFLIEKSIDKDDPRAKIAFAMYPQTYDDEYAKNVEIFDANDDPIPEDEYPEIMDIINRDLDDVRKQNKFILTGRSNIIDATRYLRQNFTVMDSDEMGDLLDRYEFSSDDLLSLIPLAQKLRDRARVKHLVRNISPSDLKNLVFNDKNIENDVAYIALVKILKSDVPLQPSQWTKIAFSEDEDIREIAARYLTNDDVLRGMMDDESVLVRKVVASRIDIDSAIEMLGTEINTDVRAMLIDRVIEEKGPDAAVSILKRLKDISDK